MVTQTPSLSELLGQDPSNLLSGVFTDDSQSIDDHAYAIALLYYLNNFYKKYKTKSYNYIEQHYQADLNQLQNQLTSKNSSELNKLYDKYAKSEMDNYNIPKSKQGQVNLQYRIDETITLVNNSITSAITEMKNDIQVKIQVWKNDLAKKATDFSITANIERLGRRIRTNIGYSTTMADQKAVRSVKSFVYGQKMLYYWVCYGPNPCSWCIANSKLPPRTIEKWEYDHPHGHCGLEAANQTEYTMEYMELIA